MSERNVVRQYIQRAGNGATKVGLAATLALSMTPAMAIAQQAGNENAQEAAAITATNTDATASEVSLNAEASSSIEQYSIDGPAAQSIANQAAASGSYDLTKIADGTYAGTAVADSNDALNVDDDEWNDESYEIKVDVKVEGGKIAALEVGSYDSLGDDDWDRMNKAVNGYSKRGTQYEGVVSQIEAAGNTANIDTVSTATISSNAIIAAVDDALQKAYDAQNPSTPITDEYAYGYAGLTWAEYWAAEGVYAAGSSASSADADTRGEYDKGAFDVVTRATTNHGLHRGSYQCMATIYTNEGATFELATWAVDGKSFTTTDGKTVMWNKGAMTCDGASYTMKDYEVTGLKYVPVKVKTSDLEAFKASHQFVANGETLAGGYGEGQLSSYSGLVAAVDADTNGLKTVTMNGSAASFSAAATGTDSGIEGQALKTADLANMGAVVKEASGSYGEFLRVDFTSNFGDLGANMQAVTWTYYGDDATRATPLATFGTKFAADNWMHKAQGIQLGLTDSLRCQLPANTNGTGYWTLTVHALGYADASYDFQATEDNIVGAKQPVTDETKAKLQALYDQAAALNKADYTEESWAASAIEAEIAETKDLLAKADLSEAEAAEQMTHLQGAIDALVKDGVAAGDYVLMNVPYAELYAADTTNNSAKVDIFTSATKAKSKTGKLSGGSYGGVSNDADDTAKTTSIDGAQFPVKVSAAAAQKIKANAYTQVTDSTSIDVTTTNRGQTSTVAYAGQKALYCEGDWAYYALGSQPSFYKELDVDADGNFVLSEVKGSAPETVKADAEFTTETTYGDYELDLDSATVESKFDHETDFIYTVLVNAVDENGVSYSYGMRPLENVWLGNELAWCSTDLIPAVHNCPTSYEHYKSLMGKTIQSVTYYTEKGAYTFELNDAVKVPVKASKSEINVEASAQPDAADIEVNATLPADFDVEYALDGKVVSVAGGKVSSDGLKPGAHTLVAHDASGKYADVVCDFVFSTDKVVAKFDEGTSKIVAANSGDDVDNFLGNITTVNVNGTDYSASGRGSVTIVNKDGSINLAAASAQQGGKSKAGGQSGQQASKVFANYGAYTIAVTSAGYNAPLTFVFNYQADRSALNAAIAQAEQLTESNYTAASWAAFEAALSAAKDAQGNVDASDDDIAQALSALTSAQAALAEKATNESKAELNQQIGAGFGLVQSDYTEDSWRMYADALAKAQALAKDPDASDADVQAAAVALKQAREALAKPAAEPATPAVPGQGGGTNGAVSTGTDGQQSAASGQQADTFAQTGDSMATFGMAAAAAAFAAAIAGAVAFARRRLLGK